MSRPSHFARLLAPALAAAACAAAALTAGRDLPPAARPGGRVLVDAHNCYPEHDRWGDRIDRAIATGLPLAIEQDLVWYRDPATSGWRSIVSHAQEDEPFTGREPSLKGHFFERIRPLVEQALREDRRERWPLIVLNLDLKSNEPEHHAAIWKTLGEYEPWLTTAERAADPAKVMPLDVKPVLVLTGSPGSQQQAFHDRVPAGSRLRLFGAIAVDVEAKVGRGREAAGKLAGLTPQDLIASGATNYRRWVNFPWAVVERGGQAQAGEWLPEDAARLAALVSRAHGLGLWIRFYTLNGHAAGEDLGWTASYNFGSLATAQARWRAARDAGVDFIASDQYEALASVVRGSGGSGVQGQAGEARLRWYKGNTHTHTLNSDGDSAPDEVARWYREHGYRFLVLSDHNFLTDVAGLNALLGADERFLLIRGEEVSDVFAGKPLHLNGLNLARLVGPQGGTSVVDTLQRNVDAIRGAEGIPHINHPNFRWAITAEELTAVRRNKLFEIFNGHPQVNNLGGGGVPGLEEVWDQILSSGQLIYGIAVDDAHHFKRPWDPAASRPGRGWVVVRAARLSPSDIVLALERGDFYASTGVEIKDYMADEKRFTVTIAETTFSKYRVQFIGSKGRLLAESTASPATYEIRGDEGYVRARVVESNGGMAWLQPVMVR